MDFAKNVSNDIKTIIKTYKDLSRSNKSSTETVEIWQQFNSKKADLETVYSDTTNQIGEYLETIHSTSSEHDVDHLSPNGTHDNDQSSFPLGCEFQRPLYTVV